jgi:hypothetical protein
MKLCQACNTEKPETEFYRDRSRSDGLNWRCKPCHKEHIAHVAMQPPRNPPPEGMKRCSRCKEMKSVDEFFADKNRYDGRQQYCMTCQNARHRQWVDENREQVNRYARERYQNDPHRYMEYERKSHYGLPHGTYERMLIEQGGKCAICGTDDPSPRRHFAVDHCHTTGTVRGLLCQSCNHGLGRFNDSPSILEKALKYLLKYSQVSPESAGV